VRALLGIAAVLLALGASPPATGREPSVPPAVGRVRAADLPREAREALAGIDRGGPFRYRQDGAVFGNRERRLPSRPRGYYREYTVPTPGAPDRGARRIVAGAHGERWYTDDHYGSFRRIEEPP